MKNVNLSTLVTKLENHIESCKKRFITLQQREMNMLADENEGVLPKVDSYGRLHAAKDGYSDVSGAFYVKGQFIPMPELPEETFLRVPKKFDKQYNRRVQIMGDIVPAFEEFIEKEEMKCVKFGLGKQFEKGGVNTCYLYMEAVTKGFMNIAFDYVLELVQAQKDIIEASKPKKDKGVAPEGKQTIVGTILGMPFVEGYYGLTQKVFIELENNATIYGTLPGKLCEAEIGDKVQFSANFTHADEDNTHAFFKRPTKPLFVEE